MVVVVVVLVVVDVEVRGGGLGVVDDAAGDRRRSPVVVADKWARIKQVGTGGNVQ
jgi:hypothetical protein